MDDELARLPGPGPAASREVDLFCVGTVFLDIVFTGLAEFPKLGTEAWAPGMGSSPGGIANLAIAASRLGLRTSLAAGFGTDVYADYCWETLSDQERVDLTPSRRFDSWHSPVTVSLALGGDRTMVTHGHPAPLGFDDLVGRPPPARAAFVHLDAESQGWLRRASAAGTLVFADLGWDPTESWSAERLGDLAHCHAFLPNAGEAMSFTRTDSPRRALSALADLVPIVVITRGEYGVVAVDATTGEHDEVPGLSVPAIDPTGAGDVFDAAFVVGTLAGWPLADRLRFGNLCAALSVQHFGGSLSAPGWGEVATWWREVRADVASPAQAELATAYAFLTELVPTAIRAPVRRAGATVAARVPAPPRAGPRPPTHPGANAPFF